MFDTTPRLIETMKPGPELAAFLSAIDVERLSGSDRIAVLRAHQRMASHYAAQSYHAMTAVSDALVEIEGVDDQAMADESAAAEIRAALRLTRRAADAEMAFAIDLRRRLPMLWWALLEGRVDVRRARTIVRHTVHLDERAAREITCRALADAPTLTTGQLAARLRRDVIEQDPDEAKKRFDHAVDARRISMEANPEGTANITAYDLPPDRTMAVTKRINRLARRLRGPGETRTMDQLRADVLLDLLEGRETGGRGSVAIRVDVRTLAELADAPGDLAGYGPVVAEIARKVADSHARGRWTYDLTDPDTGASLDTGTIRRRPSARQHRTVVARDRTCIFPGCRMPAVDCDLDHTVAWSEGGPTAVHNLAPLCRHDHRLRHEAGWSHRPLGGGDHEWTSPLGRRYTTSGRSP